MTRPATLRNRTLTMGLGITLLAAATWGLTATAMPVIMDVPLVALVIALLALVLLVPGLWKDARIRPRRRWRTGLGLAALAVAVTVSALSLYARYGSFQTDDIHFTNGAIRLAGTLYRPRTPGPWPAVVVVHGSGAETRAGYAFYARELARAGIAGLVYDKRGTGQSTGRLYGGTYTDYAADARAAVRFLKQRRDIRPTRIGLLGFSEGEWVAPLAAVESPDVAFLVIVGPSGLTPAAQVNAEIAIRLRNRGYPDPIVRQAVALNERVFAWQRTGQGKDTLEADLHAASQTPWFTAAGDIPHRLYPRDEYAWWRAVMDFDPDPIWAQVRVPVLVLKGDRDLHSQAAIARQRITTTLARGGNRELTFTVFPGADHNILLWPLGRRIPPPIFAPGYLDTMQDWIRTQTEPKK